jgi:regulator of replication initiation timing
MSEAIWTNGHQYKTLRDSIVIDGVAYSRQRLREILRERHVLAEESLRLRLEQKELREKLRRNAVHLQRRTAALTRVLARKGPVL